MTPYYEADGITIYHGDCRAIDAWLAADVLVTDPPYGMTYISGWKPDPIQNDRDSAARDAALSLWGDRPALIFGRWDQPPPVGTKLALTWDKGEWPGMGDLSLPWGPSTEEIYVLGTGFTGKRRGSVIRIDRRTGALRHPAEKPTSLLHSLLARCPAGTIADPFMGSGTTLLVAKELGRGAIGIELEERYCEIAAERLQQRILPFGTNGMTVPERAGRAG